ncbi:hypothetical protein O181_098425 [Austropuccinia psidii MF-1]|uniref:Uncharacterized protein n=1 Tax=Austropuccinia psidii MF-1 TaxID=1389203 RepID=A0A9Q3PEW8_9BASI|nr:hypothetical protein [Austropuccinia psidii MF-1]
MESTSTPIVVTASKKKKISTPKLSAASVLMDESMAVAYSDDSAKEEEAVGEPRPPPPKMTIPLAWSKLLQKSSVMVQLLAKAAWGKNMQDPSSGGKGPKNLMIIARAVGENWTGKQFYFSFECYVQSLVASAKWKEKPLMEGQAVFYYEKCGKVFNIDIHEVHPLKKGHGSHQYNYGCWMFKLKSYPPKEIVDEYWTTKPVGPLLVKWKEKNFRFHLSEPCNYCGTEEHKSGNNCPYKVALNSARQRDQPQKKSEVDTVEAGPSIPQGPPSKKKKGNNGKSHGMKKDKGKNKK